MPILTGNDSNILCILAYNPNIENKEELLINLSPEARKIADVLIGVSKGDRKIKHFVSHLKKWAKENIIK